MSDFRSKNQQDPCVAGEWIWKENVNLPLAIGNHQMFDLPENTRILDAVIKVETQAARAAGAYTGQLKLDNGPTAGGAVVNLTAASDLKAAAGVVYGLAANIKGQKVTKITGSHKATVTLDVAGGTADTLSVVTVGLFVARLDYDPS